jgi:mRNA interferase MazF
MSKDFDIWNNQKKNIHYYKQRKNYHAGDIWWMYTGVNIGFEQDGKNENFERPCLVIKGFNKEVCLIVPLSTVYKDNKFYVFVGEFEKQKNYAILSQIKLIDTKRLMNKIGSITRVELMVIKNAIWDIIR